MALKTAAPLVDVNLDVGSGAAMKASQGGEGGGGGRVGRTWEVRERLWAMYGSRSAGSSLPGNSTGTLLGCTCSCALSSESFGVKRGQKRKASKLPVWWYPVLTIHPWSGGWQPRLGLVAVLVLVVLGVLMTNEAD